MMEVKLPKFVLLLAYTLTCNAQVNDVKQTCPKFTPMKGFDISRYVGKWYEIKR